MRKNKRPGAAPAFRLIIFDFDGTLVDSVPSIHKNVNQMAKMYSKREVSRKRVIRAVGAGLNAFLTEIFAPETEKMGIERVRRDYIRLYKKNHNYGLKTYPGVRGTLKYLKSKGARLAIISNKLGLFVKSSCSYAGIRRYFSDIIGRGDFKKDKPDPFPVKHLMKKYGVPEKEVLFVGDSSYDVECAKNAGVKSVYLTFGYGDAKKTKALKPDYTFAGFRKIAGLI
ncbi:MAG TPA: HAD family hydrolase [bacterium]|nr:HAD family hydrolase [bacterium]